MDCFGEDKAKKPRKRQMSQAKRVLANRRERDRVRKMNDAFEELRSTIPSHEDTRVKTKLELLRIATNYIQSLKDHIQNTVHDNFSAPVNPLMYPPAFEVENGGAAKAGPRLGEYPFPPQLPAPPPPSFAELASFQFAAPHPSSHGSQFSTSPENTNQDFCNLFTTSLTDSTNSGDNFLYSLQVSAAYSVFF